MGNWVNAGSLEDLSARGRRVFKAGGRQLLLIKAGDRIVACNNRCPHEGYPLSEGTLGGGASGDACTLTCNWHNWKFDLASGEALVGGDKLRLYPVDVRDGRILVDVSDPPATEMQARAIAQLLAAVEDDDRGRIARELARFLKAGGDPMAGLRAVVAARADRHEYGMAHGFAAMADWIGLHRNASDDARGLVALSETVSHVAWDTLRQPAKPFAADSRPWRLEGFLDAMEREQEDLAGSYVRGALAATLPLAELQRAFGRAALSHYQDYGHSAIYTVKAFELIGLLGTEAAEPVLLSLVRSIVHANREDRIPEFRSYAPALARWEAAVRRPGLEPGDFLHLSVPATLERLLELGGDPADRYRILLAASAMAMLRFDLSVSVHFDKPVSHNVGWLDFTHMLTFANAVRRMCDEDPTLWPQALLQMGCFLGRVAPFIGRDADAGWAVGDIGDFLSRERAQLHDHGIRDPIFSCHRVKVLSAVAEEIAWVGQGPLADVLAAATNRYLNTELKQHHGLRMATQALAFVGAEG